MTQKHVKSHTRNGHQVRGYTQSGPSRAEKLKDSAAGAGVAAGGATAAAFGLADTLLTILSVVLLTVFGALLGVRLVKKRRRYRTRTKVKRYVRRQWHNRPGQQRMKVTRVPPRGSGSSAPWRGTGPWRGTAPFKGLVPAGRSGRGSTGRQFKPGPRSGTYKIRDGRPYKTR